MSKAELSDLCELLMCSDPDPTATPGCLDRVKKFADTQAREHGYTDWIDAYHRNCGVRFDRPNNPATHQSTNP